MDIEAIRIAAAAFKAALQNEDRGALVVAARRLVALKAPLQGQWQGLIQAVTRWGEFELALAAADEWSAQDGRALPKYEKANLLSRVGRSAEAAEIADALPDAAPTPVANAYLRGTLATNLGRTEEAEKHFRRALEAAPDSGRAWLGLAQLGRIRPSDGPALDRLNFTIKHAAQEDRAALEMALGLLAHGRADYDAAFAHFANAHTIQAERHVYRGEDNLASAKIAASWTDHAISSFALQPAPGERQPIFVTGLPRSGTTLVEQILAAHSQVDGGGELGLALQLEATIGGFTPADMASYLTGGGSVDDLRALYLRLAADRIPGDGRLIDKTLNQSRSLGPLSVLFPQAPILWLRRDPLDNAFSIYRTWLANNTVSGWSLADIAHHMTIEDALRDHWARELGDRMLIVPYEEVVADSAAWIDRITRHCGLEPETGQREFYLVERGVTTASALQVRQPINRKGIGVAQPYLAQLQPFVEAYAHDPEAA